MQIALLGEEATEALFGWQNQDQGSAWDGGSMERFVQSRSVCSFPVASRCGGGLLDQESPVKWIKQAYESQQAYTSAGHSPALVWRRLSSEKFHGNLTIEQWCFLYVFVHLLEKRMGSQLFNYCINGFLYCIQRVGCNWTNFL